MKRMLSNQTLKNKKITVNVLIATMQLLIYDVTESNLE